MQEPVSFIFYSREFLEYFPLFLIDFYRDRMIHFEIQISFLEPYINN